MIKPHAALYEQIAGTLRQRIDQGDFRTGTQLPIEVDLAKGMGTTRQTIRRALELLEQEGRIHRVRGKGTFVCEGTQTDTRRPLLFAGQHTGHLYQDLYLAFAAMAEEKQHSVMTFNPKDPSSNPGADLVLERCLAQCEGAVVHAEFFCSFRRSFLASGIPVVQLHTEKPMEDLPGYHIVMDRAAAVELAVNHLIAKGHRRIAYTGPAPVAEGSYTSPFPPPLVEAVWSYRGYRATLCNAGLEEGPTYAFYGGDEEKTQKMLRPFIEYIRGQATAVVCEQDWRALQIMHVARDLGLRIPEDLSVVGLGNTPWSRSTHPQMTTVSLEEGEVAHLAALLIELPQPERTVQYTVAPRLCLRGTVADLTKSQAK